MLEAELLLEQKKLICLLVTFGKLFDTSDFAIKGLQRFTLCVSDGIDLIQIL